MRYLTWPIKIIFSNNLTLAENNLLIDHLNLPKTYAFFENLKNLYSKRTKQEFDYKLNDHKDVTDKAGFTILSARPKITVINCIRFLCQNFKISEKSKKNFNT